MKPADLYMTFVIMRTDTIPDMARSVVSMRYFPPPVPEERSEKRISTPWGGGIVSPRGWYANLLIQSCTCTTFKFTNTVQHNYTAVS